MAVRDVTRARFRHGIRRVLERSPDVDDEDVTFARALGFAPVDAHASSSSPGGRTPSS